MNAMRQVYGRRCACAHAPQTMETGWFGTEEVRSMKMRLTAYVMPINTAVRKGCGLPDNIIAAWMRFDKAFFEFVKEEDSWLAASDQLARARAYERDVRNWQLLLAQHKCKVGPPVLSLLERADAMVSSDGFWPTVKTVAVAGAVIAGALALKAVLT